MHELLLGATLTSAVLIRLCWQPTAQLSDYRWHRSLVAFLLPPLLLLSSAIAILWMGPFGSMMHHQESWVSYAIAVGFGLAAIAIMLALWINAQRTLHNLRQNQPTTVHDRPAWLLETPLPFIAQIGLWNPELVVSQGILATLDAEHLEAVLTHEQAHHHYRDTFWFFWLGWLRRLTIWLPKTQELWLELLTLRELRADAWAAQQVDPLLLAESLVTLVRAPMEQPEFGAALNGEILHDRLSERIEALFSPSVDLLGWDWQSLGWTIVCLMPLLLIPFHH
ncbi:M56 family metallopeptidase [Alkalinema sp. FACHB-956]|uniref:M56 family metallopeptidase n=1 Tax=Alkalinema sp. FACHB-956 TaxID=2692768 RepID=UPI001687C52C|nr:M56 family metallopeptidase [Alkalinema sp. FACHB-956]MBD2328333.1 M56 family peptidase [Alkalinema sp. FACHB-956]